MMISLIACNSNNSSGDNATKENKSEVNEKNAKGTRSNPYSFGEDISIQNLSTDFGDKTVNELTICFDYVMPLDEAQKTYPNYSVADDHKLLIRGHAKIGECSTDDESLKPFGENYTRFIDESMTEWKAEFRMFKENDINARFEVYSNTENEFVLYCHDKKSFDAQIKYIKLNVRTENGDTPVWIQLP